MPAILVEIRTKKLELKCTAGSPELNNRREKYLVYLFWRGPLFGEWLSLPRFLVLSGTFIEFLDKYGAMGVQWRSARRRRLSRAFNSRFFFRIICTGQQALLDDWQETCPEKNTNLFHGKSLFRPNTHSNCPHVINNLLVNYYIICVSSYVLLKFIL